MYYWNRFKEIYLPALLVITGILITAAFLSGGLYFETGLGVLRIRSLSRPILFHIFFFLLWVVLSPRRKNVFFLFLKIGFFFVWSGVFLGSIGLGLSLWDFYHPIHFPVLFESSKIIPTVLHHLENTVWFFGWLIHWIWIGVSWLRAKSLKEPIAVSLQKVGKALALLNLCYGFLLFGKYDLFWDWRFIAYTALLGGIAFILQWNWPVQLGRAHRFNLYLWIGIIVFFVLFSVLGQMRYSMFRVYEDFPQSTQALWSTLHGKFMNINFWNFPGEGKSLFAQHLQPLMILFVPLYALIPDPRLLLILQVLGIALAAFFIYRIAFERLKKPWLALGFVFAYLYSPLIQRGVLHDFHLENFIPLLFFWLFYLMQKNKTFWIVCVSLIFLAVREDCFIYVFVLGAYSFLFEKKRVLGLLISLIALIWVVVALHWVVPVFKDEASHVFSGRYSSFEASGMMDLVMKSLSRPQMIFNLLTDPDAILSMVFMSLPLFFLPWLSWRGLFVIMPFNLMMFLSDFPPVRILAAFYSFMIFPGYILAAILSTEKLMNRFKNRETLLKKFISSLTAFIFISTFVFNYTFSPSHTAKHGPLDEAVNEHSPLGMHFSWVYYRDIPHYKIGRKLIRKWIPEGAPLSTEIRFATLLSNRFILRCFPNIDDAEYIFLDLKGDPVKTVFRKNMIHIVRFVYEGEYGVVFYQNGWLLLKKGYSKDKNPRTVRKILSEMDVFQFSYKTGRLVPDVKSGYDVVIEADPLSDFPAYLILKTYQNLAPGRYRVSVSLKTKDYLSKDVLGTISVLDEQGGEAELLYERALKGTDFLNRDAYQDFVFDLDIPEGRSIQFRLYYPAYGNLSFECMSLDAKEIPIDQLYQSMVL